MTTINNLIPLVIVYNALKTSRKVLGSDMPNAEEAERLETRTKEVLDKGLDGGNTLQSRGGKTFKNDLVDYVRDAIARCS